MPLSHLGNLLRRPGVVNNGAQLCDLYSSYAQTPAFLETVCNTPVGDSNTSSGWCMQTQQLVNSLQESLPVDVRRPTLPCVWPMALSSTRRSEVNAWFDRSLQNYLVFLSKSLISPDVTHNTSCLAFQKLYVSKQLFFSLFLFEVYVFVSVSWLNLVPFQCLGSWSIQLHRGGLCAGRRVQYHQELPPIRWVRAQQQSNLKFVLILLCFLIISLLSCQFVILIPTKGACRVDMRYSVDGNKFSDGTGRFLSILSFYIHSCTTCIAMHTC